MAGAINISINKTLEQEREAQAAWRRLPYYAHGSNSPPARRHLAVSADQAAAVVPDGPNLAVPAEPRSDRFARPAVNPDDQTTEALSVYTPSDNPGQTLRLRLALLVLMTVCCYGVQVLMERQRRAVEEEREFAMREGQLRSAGRVAAEFTHQIKNPLAIINNTAFSLQRALKQGKAISTEQISIIQEEVEHSDRIITQIMGYAQLSEGHVEKLNLVDELDHAVTQVFPPAAGYPVRIHADYHKPEFPPMFMQRRHLLDTFVNLLQNAREALGDKGGNIFIGAQCHADYSVEVTIRDDGSGIPPDKLERIFEAYYTTKAKGTGLGLATIKHNVELYGGTVRVESALGKGALFVLVFPAKALIKLAKQN
jgi:signal transduction histidine kinase